MLLYLVRHAIAVERAPGGESDFDRALTSEGIKKMRRHAEVLRRLQVSVEEIWTSPLVRARQTAELLADGLDCRARIVIEDALQPGGAPQDVLSELSRRAPGGNVAFVGHQPDMGELAAHLLTGRRSDVVEFKKGGVACFEIEDTASPTHGRLQWLLTPRIMATME